jgi:hypothetical protein
MALQESLGGMCSSRPRADLPDSQRCRCVRRGLLRITDADATDNYLAPLGAWRRVQRESRVGLVAQTRMPLIVAAQAHPRAPVSRSWDGKTACQTCIRLQPAECQYEPDERKTPFVGIRGEKRAYDEDWSVFGSVESSPTLCGRCIASPNRYRGTAKKQSWMLQIR